MIGQAQRAKHSTGRRKRRLLSIGHSYVAAVNRRLAHEMACAGDWEVTAAAPSLFHGELRPITLESLPGEVCHLESIRARMTRHVHVMWYGSRLRELLRQPWDMVHCWEEPFVLPGSQVAWFTPKEMPLVFYTFQNITKWYPPPFSWMEQYSIQRCDGWLAAGRLVQDAMMGRGFERKPHRIMPLGVDVDRFRPDALARNRIRTNLSWSSGSPPVVGYMGRFVPEKGLDLLMEVLDRIQSPWRALFVGAGPMEQRLREWASQYGDRVKVVTGIKHGDAADYLNAMDVLCAPSQTTSRWREQFGRMLIEAFACGVPVLASDSGEIPFVVQDAAIIAPEKDTVMWAEELGRLLENPSLRSKLSAAGLERAHSEYAWPYIAGQHLAFFDELIDARSRATA